MRAILVLALAFVGACGSVTTGADAGGDDDIDAAAQPDAGDGTPCDPNPCENGGLCSEEGDNFACRCVNNYGGATCADLVGPVEFGFTGSRTDWEVPLGVWTIHVEAMGASGGDGWNIDNPAGPKGFGGNGGLVVADLPVTPGELLTIVVGGAGANATTTGGAGGFNGGGNGADSPYGYSGGGGGGATDIRRGGTGLEHRILVAGGGGSGSGWCTSGAGNGGAGGDLTGASGQLCTGAVGTGGTQTTGGVANGAFGVGGATGLSMSQAGSAGGGGWYGGGASDGSGGGGGSSYTDGTATNVSHTQGYQDGDGRLTITW